MVQEFEDLVQRVRQARQGVPPEQDISSELMHTRVDGRLLDLRELASVLRNWTVGEVGTIAASIGILLHWLASHPNWQQRLRDEPALLVGSPDEFRMDRDPALNLLYGAGIHICPGAPLARLELRVLMEEVLARTRHITLADGHAPTRAVAPDAGYATLRMRLQ